MTDKYGPWIAFNPGDTPPAGDVKVQVQLACDTRIDAAKKPARIVSKLLWSTNGRSYAIIAYRILQQPVRCKVVFNGWIDDTGGVFNGWIDDTGGVFSNVVTGRNTHRVTFDTVDGLLIPGTYTSPDGAQIKIEVTK